MLRSRPGMIADRYTRSPEPGRGGRIRCAVAALALTASLAACGEVPLLDELSPDRTCRRTLVVGPLGVPLEVADAAEAAADSARTASEDTVTADGEPDDGPAIEEETVPEVEWKGPRSESHLHQLNAWCAAVGPAVFGGWAEIPTEPVDSVAVVAWNLHVGGGDLRRLVDDVRNGVLTGGGRVEHFVLLLQEAFREDDTVPPFEPGLPEGGGVFSSPPSGERRDIVAQAEALGLSVFYAPSMRNGEGRGDDTPEDRGNAILSTLPLDDPLAIELPVARQRRVAVAARIRAGPDPERRFLAVSVHLENDAAGFARDEQARLDQTRALLEGLPDDGIAVAGGDFNTWARGPAEALVAAMLREFPDTPPFPPGHTYVRAYGLVRRQLDYLFFRFPRELGEPVILRVPDPYASDHFPMVGWIVLPEPEEEGSG